MNFLPFLFCAALFHIAIGALAWFCVYGRQWPGRLPESERTLGKWNAFLATLGQFAASGAVLIAGLMTVMLQHRTAAELELVKETISRDFGSHGELWKAATAYYRALAKLETNDFQESEFQKAEEAMVAAEASLIFVSESVGDAWYAYWQAGRRIGELAHETPTHLHDEMWTNEARTFAEFQYQLKVASRIELGYQQPP